ncbi:hypothetical protein F4703DRAFT_1826999 [Phycomyces blakesleeanus]
MVNISPFIAKYVRTLHAHHADLEIPYSHTQFGVVLMVDVVGFSSLTAMATEKGDSGAEAIALEIGAYMGECIEIIEHFGGDVVKFLGDAVLVSFQQSLDARQTTVQPGADPSLDSIKETSERQKHVLVRRAVECGLQLLARQSHYRVYLTAEERTKHRTPTGEIDRRIRKSKKERFFLFDGSTSGVDNSLHPISTSSCSSSASVSANTNMSFFRQDDLPFQEEYTIAFNIWNCFPFIGRKRREMMYARRSSMSSVDLPGSNTNTVDLELHIALSCGDLTNIILGDFDGSDMPVSQFPTKAPGDIPELDPLMNADNPSLRYTGRLEYAICGPAVESLEEALSVAQAGEMSITKEAYDIIQKQSLDFTYEKRDNFFVIKNADTMPPMRSKMNTAMRNHHAQHGSKISTVGPNASYLAERPGLMKQASKLNIEPLVARRRNNDYMEQPNEETNENYSKYINRSALYRLQHSPDNNYPAQFRDVTIMFVSLGKLQVSTPEGLEMGQRALKIGMRSLIKYEGMLQQFAVDDKGATLLAVFGLPPLSHEREAVFAAKAALEIRDAYRAIELPGFSIALSTGIIFNAVVPQGNPYRRDPGIAGDAIIMAVRMLKLDFSKRNVVCDLATKQQIGGICDFVDYGENTVKGKVKPLPIYGINKFITGKAKRVSLHNLEKNTDFIGYKIEMRKAVEFVNNWNEESNDHLLIISGASGVGKSYFCHALNKRINSYGASCCWSSSTEVEKSSKYYLIKSILLSLFELIDSESVPQNTKRQTTYLSNSPRLSPYSMEESIGSSSSSLVPQTQSHKDRFRRLTVYSSQSRSTQNGTSGIHFELTNEVSELIARCLRKCGEDDGFLPLFRSVFATLSDIDDNKYISKLDGRARDILLAGVVTRMIRYVSEHVSLVFICDDVQWADSASIQILQHIHEHCQRVMLVLATRPIRDYKVTFITNLCATGTCEQIVLNGLGADEIGDIILQTFHTGVVKVSPEIVKVIQKRTGGNPLYVKNMAIILKDFNHVTVVDGELVPSSNKFDLEDLMGNFDYKRIIKMQYDRLDSGFQEFLTVASCLDQYFTIYEIQAVINPNNIIFHETDPQRIRDIIEHYDTYHFLNQMVENPLENSGEVYSFAHITIPQSIYYMVSYETRISLHLALARYYEGQLSRENYPELLGKVTRHYLQTDQLTKQLWYLEQLVDVNMKSYLLSEATTSLQRIVEILDKNKDLAEQYGFLRRSNIYRKLGMCYTMRTKLTEGEQYLFMALKCLGEPWPQSEAEFVYKFYVNRIIQSQHRRWGVLMKYKKEHQKELARRILQIMGQLSNIYFYTGKGRSFVYSCLVGINICEKLGEVGQVYTMFLARNSLLCWLNDQKEHSIYYITQALRYMDDKDDAGTLTICAFLCFAAGKFKNARELLYQSIEAVKTLGVITDCQSFYRSAGLVITMRIFEGTLDKSPDDLILLKQMSDTAHSNGDYEAEIWLGVYNIANLLIKNRLKDSEPFAALLEAHLKHAADYNRIAIHGVLLYFYARYRNYENARRHTKYLVQILPALTVTPNIFPIFGLVFATMGLYSMVEDEQVDLVSAGDTKNYDRFILGVSRINHAFQQVKFWEFTQPCLYLARALPYISTGRTVEGYMVLRHGVFEMHFIQEIRFLKAFYWANLGKYAFTPADRIDWTDRAKIDFDSLGIPSHVYCNPDPAKLYSRGAPADLCA